jgi:glycosyltransferase involved in cell wall biosynthesis
VGEVIDRASFYMKYLFAIKNLSDAVGGAEKVFCTVCSELARRGCQITIVTYDPPGQEPFYSLSKKINRINLDIGTPGAKTKPFDAMKKMLKLRRVLQNSKPEVAVGFMHSMFIPLSISAYGTGIPVIGSEHITIEHYRTRLFQLLLLMLTSPLLSKITVLSESIRNKYPYPVRRGMVPITNPVDLPEGRSGLKENKDRYVLLNVGRLNEQKDQLTLIKAFREIADDFPKWDLRIIGEGNLRGDLEKEINDLGLDDRVSMPGVIENISKEYLSADIFVIPSIYESFGLVTAEAMSYGLPVVGFLDCPGTNDLIKNQVNGFLVHGNEARHLQLAKKLMILMKDHLLMRKFGNGSIEIVKVKLGCDVITSKWVNLLRSVAHKSG